MTDEPKQQTCNTADPARVTTHRATITFTPHPKPEDPKPEVEEKQPDQESKE